MRTTLGGLDPENVCNKTMATEMNAACQPPACETRTGIPPMPSRRNRLAGERDYLLARLARVNAAIAALDSNPQLAELVELIESV